MDARPLDVTRRFRALHASGCFVLPNAWDAGSAALLAEAGFAAIASTSAGYAFSRAMTDGTAIGLEATLSHLRELVAAVDVPVNADFQNGFADAPADVASHVERCVATGIAGLSIEDATGDTTAPLYDAPLAVERVRAARAALDAGASGVLLTARCEAWLCGVPDAARVALDRAVAFATAGADCIFVPNIDDPRAIADLVRAVAPVPVNVLVTSADPALAVPRLADLGVRRVSTGSALARVAYGALRRAARDLRETGAVPAFAEAAPFADLQAIFAARTPRA